MTLPRARKLAVTALSSLALAAGLGSPCTASAATAKAADDFVDTVGVNTHLSYATSSIYRKYDLVEQKLRRLGARHIREGIHSGQPFHYQMLRRLAANGIRTNVIVGDPLQRWGLGTVEQQLALIKREIPNAISSLESANEYDNQGDSAWVARLRDFQQRLYTTAKADPVLSRVPVLGPSFVRRGSHVQVGDISRWVDQGNLHPYPGGQAPDRDTHMNAEIAAPVPAVGSKPLQATETGYHNGLNTAALHGASSEQAAGLYMPRLYLDYFRRGIRRAFAHELINQHPDPGLLSNEKNFGLLRNDFSEKPAYTALRRTIDLFEDPGPSFQPGSLDYAVEGPARGTLRRVLTQKRDGTFLLALWNADSVWSPDTRAPVASSSDNLRVRLPAAAHVEVHRPSESESPTAVHEGATTIPLTVSPSVAILEIKPATATEPVPPVVPVPQPQPAPPVVRSVPKLPRPASPLRGIERRMAERLLRKPTDKRAQRWLRKRAVRLRRKARHAPARARYRAIRQVLRHAR